MKKEVHFARYLDEISYNLDSPLSFSWSSESESEYTLSESSPDNQNNWQSRRSKSVNSASRKERNFGSSLDFEEQDRNLCKTCRERSTSPSPKQAILASPGWGWKRSKSSSHKTSSHKHVKNGKNELLLKELRKASGKRKSKRSQSKSKCRNL